MILTFTDYIAPTQTAAGKWPPSKAKASDGKTYALPKDAVELIKNSLGTPLECEVESRKNGQWWNHSVLSARHVASVAEPSRNVAVPLPTETADFPKSTTQEGQSPTPAAPAWFPDKDKQKLIVRQSSIKAAVDLVVAGKAPAGLWETAELIETWVWDNETTPAEKSAPHASTPAQQIVESMKEKAADIRSGYNKEDAVCPACGRREFLKQWTGGWFCARSKVAGEPGGCGYPNKGERLDAPVTYGEWLEKQSNIRRPDAAVVSPSSLPSRAR